ncbi:MAG: serine/threonine-protein kinase [Vicinamibacterales bacterium]
MGAIKSGAVFGRWKLVERIGGGGSSIVWKANRPDGTMAAAIKFIKHKYFSQKSYERVKNEVAAMTACADIDGVLPLWDSEVPDEPNREGEVWLAFPLATPLSEWTGDGAVDEAVSVCASLAETLSKMHARGYSHRDIKPANILFWNGRWNLGDFGIAAGPEFSRQTQPGEKLGPAFYIAPEMLNSATASDGSRADVYSIAKLLWKLVTGQTYPLPGMQPRAVEALTASAYVADRRVYALDAVIEAATQHHPSDRPSMADVARSLNAWFDPPPVSSGPLDLAALKGPVAEIIQPIQTEELRRGRLRQDAVLAIEQFFWPFRSLVGGFTNPFQEIGLYDIERSDVAEGNAHFWPDVPRDCDSYWQYSINATIRSDHRRATLWGGVTAGFKYAEITTPDIHVSALGAAGWFLELHVFDGEKWNESRLMLWNSGKEKFILHAPDSVAAQERFKAGLIDNLKPSIEAFLQAFQNTTIA